MSARIVLNLCRPVRRWLQRRLHKSRDATLRTRLQIVLLYGQGWGAHRIAAALGCVPATAVRVVRRYMELGEEGLQDGRSENGCPKVDEDLVEALAELVAGNAEEHGWRRPTWTRELLAKTLYEMTGVRVSVTTIARMLRRLNIRWGMTRPVVVCPWPQARKKRRVRRILKIIKHLPRREVAYFEDELDVHLNPRIGRDWMLRGQQKLVVTPGKNKKRYIAGALQVGTGRLVVVEASRKNTDLFIELLKKLRRVHRDARRIHLVVDNYVIHSSRKLQRYLRDHDDLFVLHYLPPYSPEHNDIERIWREVHANVTRNHRCKSIEDLMRRVRWYLSGLSRKNQRRSEPRRVHSTRRHRAA